MIHMSKEAIVHENGHAESSKKIKEFFTKGWGIPIIIALLVSVALPLLILLL
jgi:hypothetical protein